MMIVRAYECEKQPDALELITDILPLLNKEHAYKYMLNHHHLIKTAAQALIVFKLLFDHTGTDTNFDQRLTFAYNILPVIKTKKDLDTVLSYLHPNHREEFSNSAWCEHTANYIRHT
jgi:hypothetical protein